MQGDNTALHYATVRGDLEGMDKLLVKEYPSDESGSLFNREGGGEAQNEEEAYTTIMRLLVDVKRCDVNALNDVCQLWGWRLHLILGSLFLNFCLLGITYSSSHFGFRDC